MESTDDIGFTVTQLFSMYPFLKNYPENHFSDDYKPYLNPDLKQNPVHVELMAEMDAELAKYIAQRELTKFVFATKHVELMAKMDAELAKYKAQRELTKFVFASELFRVKNLDGIKIHNSDAVRHNIGIMPSNTGQVFIEDACQEDENLEIEFTMFLLPSFNICNECTFPIGLYHHKCPSFFDLERFLSRMKLPIPAQDLIFYYPCNGIKGNMEKLIQKTLPITLHAMNEFKNKTLTILSVYDRYICWEKSVPKFDMPNSDIQIYFSHITPFP